jgi:wyosine [tRNA(Phe)-imidazoG37] synthetase (radical SAM superfamily)
MERMERRGESICRPSEEMALGCPRFYLGASRLVYAVLSSRARGLSLGVNLNPDQYCNFDCCYCEVSRQAARKAAGPAAVNAQAVAAELTEALSEVNDGVLLRHAPFAALSKENLRLAHVAISGDGEPTLCPNFSEAVECIVHLRAAGIAPYFKMVLLTNGTAFEQPGVRAGLRLFTRSDEIWVKLDAGTQAGLERINRTAVPFERILRNITELGRVRPIVIQSMFVEVDGVLPERSELLEYSRRLLQLKQSGVQISVVQVYSATRPHHTKMCRHLSLRVLSDVAAAVHQMTGLRVEVF